MAPSLEEPIIPQVISFEKKSKLFPLRSSLANDYQPGHTAVVSHDHYEHDDLLPRFPDVHWSPLREVPYFDKGLNGHAKFFNLLSTATDVFDYTPKIGTEIHGVRLSQLSDAQKCDLARLISVRGVVFFRNQDDFDIDRQRELGSFLGTLHKHATTSVPRKPGLEDVHVVYTDEKSTDMRAVFSPSFLWHSDVRHLPCLTEFC